MALSRSIALRLELYECAAVNREEHVVELAHRCDAAGLRPAVGFWSETQRPVPVDDIPGLVRERCDDFADKYPAYRFTRFFHRVQWPFGLVQDEEPGPGRTISSFVSPSRGTRVEWSLTRDPRYLSRPESEYWPFVAALLERLGHELFRSTGSACGLITAIDVRRDDTWISTSVLRAAARADLVLGWRTWLGPSYLDRWGRDFLLGLPDRAVQLDEQCILHAMDFPPTTLGVGSDPAFGRLHAYLSPAGIRPAWPRRIPRATGRRPPAARR